MGIVLRFEFDFTGNVSGQGLDQQLAANLTQTIVNRGGGVGYFDGSLADCHDIAGVHAGVHLHHGHAGFFVTVPNGPLDWGGTTVFGKNGGVDVEATVLRNIQKDLRQNLAVGHHYDYLGLPSAELVEEFGGAAFLRLVDGDTEFVSHDPGGGGLQLELAAFGAIRLRDNGDQFHTVT